MRNLIFILSISCSYGFFHSVDRSVVETTSAEITEEYDSVAEAGDLTDDMTGDVADDITGDVNENDEQGTQASETDEDRIADDAGSDSDAGALESSQEVSPEGDKDLEAYSSNLDFISNYTYQYNRVWVEKLSENEACRIGKRSVLPAGFFIGKQAEELHDCIRETYSYFFEKNGRLDNVYNSLVGLKNLLNDHKQAGWSNFADSLVLTIDWIEGQLPHTIKPLAPLMADSYFETFWDEDNQPVVSVKDQKKRELIREKQRELKEKHIELSERSADKLRELIAEGGPSSDLGTPSEKRAPFRTVNIFLMGTGSNFAGRLPSKQFPEGELIQVLADNTVGVQNVDWIAINGLGSKGNFFTSFLELSFGAGLASMTSKAAHVVSLLKGDYKKADSREFLDCENPADFKVVSQLAKAGYLWSIKNINIVGFSRGAATAIKLAEALHLDSALSEIPVNLFAIDPVHGRVYSGTDLSQYTIHENVKNYTSVISGHERSAFFEVVIPDIKSSETNVEMVVVPGNHSNMIGSVERKTGSSTYDLSGAGKIVRSLAEEFLEKHGALLKNTLDLDYLEKLNLYRDNITSNMDGYKDLTKEVYLYYENGGQNEHRLTFRGNNLNEQIQQISSSSEDESCDKEGGCYINSHHKKISEYIKTRKKEAWYSISRLWNRGS